MKRIVVSVTNDLTTDQRVHKVCTTLFNSGFDVLLIGRKLKNSKPLNRTYKTKRISLFFTKGVLFYAEYNLRLFFKLFFLKKNILLANDLDTLLPNYLISNILNKKLVYDSHELFSELPSIQGRYSQKVWRFLEKWLVPRQHNFYTVSNSIANWYHKKYGVKPLVIKNYPTAKKVVTSQPKKSYILYQGALNKGRGLIPLLNAMQFIENSSLLIAGDGPFKSKIKNYCTKHNLENKVELLGNIPPEELRTLTQNATLGISLEEDLGLSYRYALPNKLFDYIQAKTPVVATYLPEIKKVVKTYKVGEIIENHAPENIAKAITKVLKNGKPYYTTQLEKAAKELVWERQEKLLLRIFNNI